MNDANTNTTPSTNTTTTGYTNADPTTTDPNTILSTLFTTRPEFAIAFANLIQQHTPPILINPTSTTPTNAPPPYPPTYQLPQFYSTNPPHPPTHGLRQDITGRPFGPTPTPLPSLPPQLLHSTPTPLTPPLLASSTRTTVMNYHTLRVTSSQPHNPPPTPKLTPQHLST